MKRISVLLVLLLVLCACVPTPETEYVVNKADNTVEEKLNAASTENRDQKEIFPEHWTEEKTPIDEHLSLFIDADLITKEDGLYPVYRTKTAEITSAEAGKWAGEILGTPESRTGTVTTKEQLQKEMQRYLDQIAALQAWIDADRPDDGVDRDEYMPSQEEQEEFINSYMEMIDKAPEKNDSTEVSDLQNMPKGGFVYTMTDGSSGYVYSAEDCVIVAKSDAADPYLYYSYYYEEEKDDYDPDYPWPALWKDVTLSREDAEAMLKREIERLGFSDFTVTQATTANLLCSSPTKKSDAQGWAFTLKRNPAGYPNAGVPYEPSQALQYGSGDDFMANPHVRDEEVEILIDESGLRFFVYSGKREVIGLENPNVELLPFETVKERVKNAFASCYPRDGFRAYRDGEQSNVTLEVYEMLLTPFTIRVKNSEELYEMPCWIVFFDEYVNDQRMAGRRDDPDMMHECMVINAVDGSIVHTEWNW